MVNKKSILMPTLIAVMAANPVLAGNNTNSDLIFADGMIGKCSVGLGLGDKTIESRLGCAFEKFDVMLTHSDSTKFHEIPEYGVGTNYTSKEESIKFGYRWNKWKASIGAIKNSNTFYQNDFNGVVNGDSTKKAFFTIPNENHPTELSFGLDYIVNEVDTINVDITNSSFGIGYTWGVTDNKDKKIGTIGITRSIKKPNYKHEIKNLVYADSGLDSF
jgi:hypothetical protein